MDQMSSDAVSKSNRVIEIFQALPRASLKRRVEHNVACCIKSDNVFFPASLYPDNGESSQTTEDNSVMEESA